MDCPFCKQTNERLLKEGLRTRILFSDPCLMPGHLLVVPKRHVVHLAELDADERLELFDTVIEYQQQIMKTFASGCDISQHDRPFLPQSQLKIDHVHFHLRPREPFDAYWEATKGETELFLPLEDAKKNEFLQILKK
jgi:diadenosine tetraphosphate (Ap4A) HIT family hydrolase